MKSSVDIFRSESGCVLRSVLQCAPRHVLVLTVIVSLVYLAHQSLQTLL